MTPAGVSTYYTERCSLTSRINGMAIHTSLFSPFSLGYPKDTTVYVKTVKKYYNVLYSSMFRVVSTNSFLLFY